MTTVGDFNKASSATSSSNVGTLQRAPSPQSDGGAFSPSSRRSLAGGLKRSASFKGAESTRRQHMITLQREIAKKPQLQVLGEFYMWSLKKFGNLTRCWHQLDTSKDMKLTYFEFALALKKLGWSGDAKKVFNTLDRDRSGNLSFYHFDPSGARELAKLCSWAEQKFGNLQSCFKALDRDGNGKLTMEEVREGLRQHGFESPGSFASFFMMMDLDQNKKVTASELAFIDYWKCPVWLKCQEVDVDGAKQFRRLLLERFKKNNLSAWFGMDSKKDNRVSWEEFSLLNEKLNLVPKARLPGIWKVLDSNLSGWLSLREWSMESYLLLTKFKAWCEARNGSIFKAIESLDTNGNGLLSRREFTMVTDALKLDAKEAETLFDGLDVAGEHRIHASKLKYLDRWAHQEELEEEDFWDILNHHSYTVA